ncbi:hypothetical protein [Chondromyces crocatus]|uniref:Glycosyl hydrolase family 32 N-terminal domain-containing protein n=1 Tax=Chondromyces crocatus TaxID=52 RepID=A0A0K1ELP2_CHOCO|nr:hypothetical protein [Chondromyces crocatus]AKT41736.1 uncharacterized protein CMC5_059470 [Chondromyces crocatus]
MRPQVVPLLASLLVLPVSCGSADDGSSGTPTTPPPPETLGTAWEAESVSPLALSSPCPSFSCLATTDPSLVRSADGDLLLYFSAGGIREEGDGSHAVWGPTIGRARRADGQETFVLDPVDRPVVDAAPVGAWDRHVETVSVFADPATSRYRMVYMGYEARPGDPNYVDGGPTTYQGTALGQMTSSDPEGKVWQRNPEPIYRPAPDAWDGLFITGASVVIGPDGVWRLYYSGAGTTVGIGLLTSNDGGDTWQPHHAPVLERDLGGWDQAVLEPTVRYFGGQFWMWYSGYEEPLGDATRIAIGLATSADGVTWQRHPGNPVLGPGAAGSWNDMRVLSSDVLVDADGSLLMAAYGCSLAGLCDDGDARIGLFRSR